MNMHDFRGKLSDPRVAPMVEDYLRRTRARRAGAELSPSADSRPPAFGPISINLDLTMACDYRCDHCIDIDLLNTGLKFEFLELENTLRVMAGKALRSVILIGGGEPTLHPDFERVVLLIKSLGLQCAIVSNGAHNDRIAGVVHRLEKGDWVRLSLDAGTDKTFQALHRPRRAVTLDYICRTAASLKERQPQLQLGFSFVVMWDGMGQISAPVMSNVGEMALAADLAKAHGFDYISFKPMLVRNEEQAEIVNIARLPGSPRPIVPAPVIEEIRVGLRQAEAIGGVSFRVVPSKNLIAMLQESGFERCRQQPRECHMQHFRQVLTPAGVFTCPAHRGNERSRTGERTAYCTTDGFSDAFETTQAQVQRFNAAVECREITCIYNDINWWIEDLLESGEELTPGVAADLFL
jgi:pyruvate-formate lyase-activating enzyme